MSVINYILDNPGPSWAMLGLLFIISTITIMGSTIDVGAVTILNTSILTSGSFHIWVASLLLLGLVILAMIYSRTVRNTNIFLLYIVLFSFIMTHFSIYQSLGNVIVSN